MFVKKKKLVGRIMIKGLEDIVHWLSKALG